MQPAPTRSDSSAVNPISSLPPSNNAKTATILTWCHSGTTQAQAMAAHRPFPSSRRGRLINPSKLANSRTSFAQPPKGPEWRPELLGMTSSVGSLQKQTRTIHPLVSSTVSWSQWLREWSCHSPHSASRSCLLPLLFHGAPRSAPLVQSPLQEPLPEPQA